MEKQNKQFDFTSQVNKIDKELNGLWEVRKLLDDKECEILKQTLLLFKEKYNTNRIRFDAFQTSSVNIFNTITSACDCLEELTFNNKGIITSLRVTEPINNIELKRKPKDLEFWNVAGIIAQMVVEQIQKGRCIFKIFDKVRWNDPAIEEYDPEDREAVLSRIFEVTEVSEDIIYITDGVTEAEVLPSELELIER